MSTDNLSRRQTLAGVALAGVGVPLLAACGEDATSSSRASEPSGTPSPGGGAGSGSAGGDVLASTADVPVGGCAVYPDAKLVVTQPAEGEFRCFTAVCTHQGCLVSSSSDGVIPCPCHGSQFSLEDGSVVEGPASSPLEAVSIVVEGDDITLA